MNPNPDHAADAEGDATPAKVPESPPEAADKPARRKRSAKVADSAEHNVPEMALAVEGAEALPDDTGSGVPPEPDGIDVVSTTGEPNGSDTLRHGRRQRRRGPRVDEVGAAGSADERANTNADECGVCAKGGNLLCCEPLSPDVSQKVEILDETILCAMVNEVCVEG